MKPESVYRTDQICVLKGDQASLNRFLAEKQSKLTMNKANLCCNWSG